MISRRLTPKEKFTNPWKIILHRDIYSFVFIEFYRAIKDYKISFGRNFSVKKDRRGKITSIIIKFIHEGTLLFHLSCVSNKSTSEVKQFFRKTWNNGNRAKVIVNEEKPAVLTYNNLKHTLTFQLHYELKNNYGTVCSF